MLNRCLEWWRTRRRRKHLQEMIGHLRHVRHVHDDILPPATLARLDELIAEGRTVDPADAAACEQYLDRAPLRAAKVLPRQRFPVLREYLDIFAVAFTVAFGIRALALQPFKIPTSSMQPTLFGIHYVAAAGPGGYRPLPALPQPLQFLLFSARRAELKVERAGQLDEASIQNFTRWLLFPQSQFDIGGVEYRLPGVLTPLAVENRDPSSIDKYALGGRRFFAAGQEVCRGWLSLGDHLFVDRVSHHFRAPRRGDIVIFNTEGIAYRGRALDGYYYIKRLVGLPGDVLRVEGNLLYVQPAGSTQEAPIAQLNQRFAKLYGGTGGYRGHHYGDLQSASYLKGPQDRFTVPADSYFVMGDNTEFSQDSRYWGVVPRRNFVGRACFVFWPFSRRWGIPDQRPPLPFSSYGDAAPMTLQ